MCDIERRGSSAMASDSESNQSNAVGSDSLQPVNQLIPVDPLIIENFDDHLPDTVRLLKSRNNAKVYLVGTAHFSKESQDDVSTVIRNVRPHIVVVELCKDREIILKLDEEAALRLSRSINTFKGVESMIETYGFSKALIMMLFQKVSDKMIEQLGMFPGGEFRTAFAEAKMLENCMFRLGDRPIEVTLERFWSVLSWWNSFRLICCLPFSITVTKEFVENLKQKGTQEQLLKKISVEFPELLQTFIEERDMFLTYSLQKAANYQSPMAEPTRVVGVVGIGHLEGITKLWGTVKASDIPPLMVIPPPSKSGQLIKFIFKVAVRGLLFWGMYKVFSKAFPVAISEVPKKISSLVSQVEGHKAYLSYIKPGTNFYT